MTLVLCLILVCAALYCVWRGRRLAAAVWLVADLVLVSAVGCGIVGLELSRSQPEAATLAKVRWQLHNTIVLLGAGTLAPDGSGVRIPFYGFARVLTTADAYYACRRQADDCKIVVSGGDPQKHGETEAAVYARALLDIKVPEGDVAQEARSNNTWQNARYATSLVAKDRGIVVVTSGFQLRRAMLYFAHFRPDVQGVGADEMKIELGALPTSENVLGFDALLHERLSIWRYHVYNALGMNPAKAN